MGVMAHFVGDGVVDDFDWDVGVFEHAGDGDVGVFGGSL